MIIFYGDCAFASSPGTITSPFVRFRSLGDSFFYKEGDEILAPFATGAVMHKKTPDENQVFLDLETKASLFFNGTTSKRAVRRFVTSAAQGSDSEPSELFGANKKHRYFYRCFLTLSGSLTFFNGSRIRGLDQTKSKLF